MVWNVVYIAILADCINQIHRTAAWHEKSGFHALLRNIRKNVVGNATHISHANPLSIMTPPPTQPAAGLRTSNDGSEKARALRH
jgi:hypothetical protein